MADFDKYDYEINKRLPEWYKHVNGLEPINRYTQELLISILEGFLKNLGLVQPIQVWKTLPEEYNWEHKYYNKDIWVGNTTLNEKADLKISNDKPLFLKIPNTKRPTDAVIDIHFTGNKNNQTKPIKKLLIKNADQMILFKNITTKTSIKINTDGNILIDGVNKDDLIDGKIYKIKPIARNDKYDDVSIDDENKKTQLELYVDIPPITINGQDTPDEVKLEAKITNKKPIYVTEQNVRLYTVSAFPLKSVKLYGFFCHDFNNKQEWKLLWEKEYSENTRTVYDRITKQYDCERFYVQVQYYGLGLPISIGFPQEQYSSDVSFQINDRLDYWGAIYGLPRRHYKPHITEDEEPYTFPKYYAYPIEQDYWYEERLVSEYRKNINAKDIDFLKDSEDNNIALMKNIDPYLNDVWIYTETITPTIDMSAETKGILPCSVKQDETTDGVSWKNEQRVGDTQLLTSDLHLEPQNAKNYNNRSFMGKVLQLKFKVPELPKDIEITGLELKLKGVTDLHSDTIILDNRSNFKLPFKYEKANGDKFVKKETFLLNMFDVYGDFGLNIFNSESAELFNSPIISFEATLEQANKINADDTGVIGYGYLPLMLTRNCPIKNHLGCAECTGRLTDRKGFEFAVKCNKYPCVEILNPVPIYMGDRQDEIHTDFIHLYFTDESRAQVEKIIDMFKTGSAFEGKYTRGLTYRGVE